MQCLAEEATEVRVRGPIRPYGEWAVVQDVARVVAEAGVESVKLGESEGCLLFEVRPFVNFAGSRFCCG